MRKLVIAFVLVGCGVSQFSVKRDDFDKKTRSEMQNSIGGGLFGGLNLNLVNVKYDTGHSYNFIRLVYIASDWLFIQEGESLTFLVDDERIPIEADGKPNDNQVISTMITEEGYYPVSIKFLERLSRAKTVKVKVSGLHSYIQNEFSPTNIQNVREFLSRIAPSPDGGT